MRLLLHRYSALIRLSQVVGNRERNKKTDVLQPGLGKKGASSCSLVREKQYKSPEQYLWFCVTFTETFSSLKTSHNLLKHHWGWPQVPCFCTRCLLFLFCCHFFFLNKWNVDHISYSISSAFTAAFTTATCTVRTYQPVFNSELHYLKMWFK